MKTSVTEPSGWALATAKMATMGTSHDRDLLSLGRSRVRRSTVRAKQWAKRRGGWVQAVEFERRGNGGFR